jgi:glycosyltransferase involved in cell wall biosynthesis
MGTAHPLEDGGKTVQRLVSARSFMTRVAFVVPGSGWMGGASYFRNLVLALSESPQLGIEPVFLAGKGERLPPEFPPVRVIQTSLLDEGALLWRVRFQWRGRFGTDSLLDRKLRKSGIGLLSHDGDLGIRAKTPTIGWIADFQHRWLPDFFSPEERKRRDAAYDIICRRSMRIVVSSEVARSDLANFFPQGAEKARVLRFVDCSASSIPGRGIAELERKYAFRHPYLLLPNQFWAHKNHGIVMEAIRILRDSGRSVTVLATGDTHDYRNPLFFGTIMRERAAHRIEDLFRVLGPVPYEDLVGLMRHAAALVNPSLFEGWSTVVEEAKSLGKRILLSDIPVHREQAPERGTYFDPADATALSCLLWQVCSEQDAGEEGWWASRAAGMLPIRRREFARTYAQIVAECT